MYIKTKNILYITFFRFVYINPLIVQNRRRSQV